MTRTLAPPRGAASQDVVRRHNLGTVLRLLHLRGATTRSALAARTGLNRSTVGALTSQLVDAGLLHQTAPSRPRGAGVTGRPSITVAPSPSTYAVAVEIGVESVSAARVGLGGTVLQRRRLAQDDRDRDPEHAVERVRGLVDGLLADAGPADVCLGIGVAVCGLVRDGDGVVRLAPNLHWVDVPLRALLLEVGWDLPVLVGNEADLGAVAEQLRGAGTGVSDLVYLSGEVGIGGGVILGGRPLRGAGGYAGELGHLAVDPDGRPCRCGRTGCWETEVGEDAVLRAVGVPHGTGWESVLASHAAGDRRTRAGLDAVGTWLGLGVANLVNLLNPELVLFGGLTRHVFVAAEASVRRALDAALQAPREQVRLALPGLGDDSNLLGASELVFQALLDDPLAVLEDAQRGAGRPSVDRVPHGAPLL